MGSQGIPCPLNSPQFHHPYLFLCPLSVVSLGTTPDSLQPPPSPRPVNLISVYPPPLLCANCLLVPSSKPTFQSQRASFNAFTRRPYPPQNFLLFFLLSLFPAPAFPHRPRPLLFLMPSVVGRLVHQLSIFRENAFRLKRNVIHPAPRPRGRFLRATNSLGDGMCGSRGRSGREGCQT